MDVGFFTVLCDVEAALVGSIRTEVRGHGQQKGHTAVYRGQEYNVSLLPKMQIEVVVDDRLKSEAVTAVMEAAKTGQIGDGRIFVMPVEASYRIRTGELELQRMGKRPSDDDGLLFANSLAGGSKWK